MYLGASGCEKAIVYLVKSVESLTLQSLALNMSTDGASPIVAGKMFNSTIVIGI